MNNIEEMKDIIISNLNDWVIRTYVVAEIMILQKASDFGVTRQYISSHIDAQAKKMTSYVDHIQDHTLFALDAVFDLIKELKSDTMKMIVKILKEEDLL